MNPPLTYRLKSTSPNIGGYRYFFNGQEGDNEVFGEVVGFGHEFRQYDSRLGRSTIKIAHLCIIRGFCVNLQFIIHWNIN
jgi:hypothetical protein